MHSIRILWVTILLVYLTGSPLTKAVEAASPPPTEAALDEILLKNGSRILGKVTHARDGKITVETDFAGTIDIDSSAVESFQTQGSFSVLLNNGDVIEGHPIRVDSTGLLVTLDNGHTQPIEPNGFSILNPEPWELGIGYQRTGSVSVAIKQERGNSNTDELDYKVEANWRSLRNRYIMEMRGELDKSNGLTNTNNVRLVGKFDHFLEGNDYWGAKFAAKTDEFADLDLRAYIGPYYGRQFYSKPVFSLSGELGAAYVSEDFIIADDQRYPAALWAIDISSNYLGGDSNLYLSQGGLWNLKDSDDVILTTTLGLSFPLLGKLEAAAEIFIEFDSGAVEGIEELDQTYRFRLGYSW